MLDYESSPFPHNSTGILNNWEIAGGGAVGKTALLANLLVLSEYVVNESKNMLAICQF